MNSLTYRYTTSGYKSIGLETYIISVEFIFSKLYILSSDTNTVIKFKKILFPGVQD